MKIEGQNFAAVKSDDDCGGGEEGAEGDFGFGFYFVCEEEVEGEEAADDVGDGEGGDAEFEAKESAH